MTPSIRAHDLEIGYRGARKAALRGVTLDVPAGACLLVVGPSGSGKSTLGLALAGLIPRDIPGEVRGELLVDGLDPRVSDQGQVAARVGIVFQDPGAQLVMERVEDDVAFGLENRAWARPAMLERVAEAIAEVGLSGLERRRSNRLSGGQQQRLALAGVLAARPRILVLDEPTANLDPEGTATFYDGLRRLRAQRATTIVLVEHDVEAAWPMADLVLALGRDGVPIDVGPPDEVLRRSADRMAEAGIWLPAEIERTSRPIAAPVARARATPVVRATNVGFAYERGAPVLRDVELTVAAGERIVLVGANGSGKSTLGLLLVGLLRATSGEVRLLGSDSSRLPPAAFARRAGYVFQDPEAGFLTDTVRDEVMLGLTPNEAADAPALMARLRLPLEVFGDRSPYRLSGGEARRLSLACTLVRRPRLLVLDEPTFGQDRLGYEGLLEILRERIDDDVCLIAATHDHRLVADVASRIVELEAGRIVSDRPAPAAQTAGSRP
ncbi:MAG: ATP-binding cassette domain-containing protein [Chloroflexota bacterium]